MPTGRDTDACMFFLGGGVEKRHKKAHPNAYFFFKHTHS